ncbi:MAG: amidase [Candidatus Hodarchaeota archaeon]
MNKNDIFYISAVELSNIIRSQTITAEEIIERFISRIEKLDPILKSYCTLTFDLAREKAKEIDRKINKNEPLGVLEGIPTALKDDIEVKNIRTTFGSKIFENYFPKSDEIIVKRLRDAGVVILGKTNMPEQGFKGVTDNLIFGTTKNPWNLEKTPGGSSGGSAVAIASGMSTLAIGSDGGGSVRIPSSFCGVFGFKPTFGRIPQDTLRFFGNTGSLVHIGPIVRYVRDAAIVMDVISGEDDSDRYSLPKEKFSYSEKVENTPKKLKIGYSLDLGFVKVIDTEVKEKVLTGIQNFEDLGYRIEPSNISLKNAESAMWILWNVGYAYALKSYLKEFENKIDPELRRTIEIGLSFTVQDVITAELQRERIYEEICKTLNKFDVLITPTTACLPFELNKSSPERINDKEISPLEWIPFTYPFNMSGHPVASIPVGWSKSGLPIGMQIIGRRLDDLSVLQASLIYEEIAPWQNRVPTFKDA